MKKIKIKGGLKQDDDQKPFVKDTVDPAQNWTFAMLRDKGRRNGPDRGKSRGRRNQHKLNKWELRNWG
jgi:hypothetical protein